jgi:DNA repair exonuclease SbcCD ATPase subunit
MKRIFSEIEKDLKEYQSNQNKEREKYHSISAHIKQMQSDLKKTLDQMREDQVDSIISLISKMEKDLESDEKSASDQRSELKILDTLNDILSDSGIKKDLLDKVIPSLNSRISAISERLDFKFSFEFNNDFDPIITYLGMQVSPNSLSSGQRKKMNLIVLLAFIEIIKMKHSHMNVMFLDEIFSSLDRNNVYLAIEILREYAIKYNMTVFVVSHEPLPEEFFDYKIYVKSVNNFSEMEMIKNSNL